MVSLRPVHAMQLDVQTPFKVTDSLIIFLVLVYWYKGMVRNKSYSVNQPLRLKSVDQKMYKNHAVIS